MRRLSAMLGLSLLGLGLAAGGEGPDSARIVVRLDQVAGTASPLVFGCSLPAPGTPGADALLPELLRNRSFEKVALLGPKRMPAGWSKAQGWQLFAFGGKHAIVRSERDRDEPLVLLDQRPWGDYHLSLRARKVDGPGGLQVLLEVQDQKNHVRWSLGAHGNRHHVLESIGRGRPRLLTPPVPGSIEAGRVYRIDMSIREGVLQCSLDGRLVHQVGDGQFADAGIGLGATDSTAEYFDIVVRGPNETPLFLLDDPSKKTLDTLAGDWAPIRSPNAKVGLAWDPVYPYSGHFSQSIRVEAGEGGEGGIAQGPIPVRAGVAYAGRLHMRGAGRAKLAVSLRSSGGKVYASQPLSDLSGTWAAHDFSLRPNASDPQALFALTIAGAATVWVDQASLAEEGSRSPWALRADVVAALGALKPTLLCWPAGPGANQYTWHRAIGPADQRPPLPCTTGSAALFEPASADFGTDEFLRLCQHLGAEPVVTLNPRLTTQAILDLLRYCNGAADTPLGQRRAANGHKEPYNVRFWLVGGERQSEAGAEAYSVTLAELGRDMRGFRPTPQIIALGGPVLGDCEEDVREARQAGPLLTHIAKALAWQGGADEGPIPKAALDAAARRLRAQSLNLALPDCTLARDASSSASAMGMLLNALSLEGGPAALAAFRCLPTKAGPDAASPLDLFAGRNGRSPALAAWALYRAHPLGEALRLQLSGSKTEPSALDAAAGRNGDEVVLRIASIADDALTVQVTFEGLPQGRRLAPRARHFVVPSGGARQVTEPLPGAELPVQDGRLSLPLQAGPAAHLVVVNLEGG